MLQNKYKVPSLVTNSLCTKINIFMSLITFLHLAWLAPNNNINYPPTDKIYANF